ncbi:hypothetical protein [Pedobacter steynii]|uniref:PH domain-containing protein n=1 Tax=Pedobacter steynii TaxID=430522 RepID=A0A1D7QK90_9SPHI|nr:hypothetical protein [Pedobacter steynii]AOM79101.1 hypothetical protein BFS30_19160 [Pedobacter steynii]
MTEIKSKSSILLSIFRRKGGEGVLTKIINEDNKLNFSNQVALIKADEQPLLCFKKDELNWLFITSDRIIESEESIILSIPYCELVEVSLAIQEEFRDRVMNKENFTRLVLKASNGQRYVLKLEKGKPYQGIYQMLHHVVTKGGDNH